ncbi:hypothetical protein Pelo_19710 [Pelomyxa schiedti]|nr:hypothetical protein Pelo_19710 [Pelomyxa schiedti]
MSSDFPPLPRLLHAPFRGKKSLSVLQSELHGSDHNLFHARLFLRRCGVGKVAERCFDSRWIHRPGS